MIREESDWVSEIPATGAIRRRREQAFLLACAMTATFVLRRVNKPFSQSDEGSVLPSA